MFNECQLNFNPAELWFLRIAWQQLVRGAPRPRGPSLIIVIHGDPGPAPPQGHAAAEISIGLQLQLKHRHQVMTPHLPIFKIIWRPNNHSLIQTQLVSQGILKKFFSDKPTSLKKVRQVKTN